MAGDKKKTNIYVLIDTNTIVSFFENGFSVVNPKGTLSQPESFEALNNLWKVLKENKIILIVPEVVEIECKRIMYEKSSELDTLYEEVKNGIQKAVTINRRISQESSDVIKKTVNSVNKKERDKIKKSWSLIERILKHKNTLVINMDEEIIVNAYKRGLMGKKPFSMKYINSKEGSNKPVFDIQPDCVVVESAKKFIKEKTNYELYLCTNDANFYETFEKKDLDDSIKTELGVKGCFTSISDFLLTMFKIQPKPLLQRHEQESSAYPVIGENQTVNDGVNIELGVVNNFGSSVK